MVRTMWGERGQAQGLPLRERLVEGGDHVGGARGQAQGRPLRERLRGTYYWLDTMLGKKKHGG